MFLFRESSSKDVGQIAEVAKHLDTVNLPANKTHLEQIIAHSAKSFSGEIEKSEREFLFVLEDLDTNRIIGTSIIHAQHGTKRSPHVYFRVSKDERYSETIDRYVVHQCLQLGYNYDGPTEIGGLILLPQYRGHPKSLGKTLSYARFLFIAMHRDIFRDQVLSELLPPLESDGTSKLWKHLGRRFTGLSYQEADHLSKDNKEFIRALFPHSLIYTSLFPDDVRKVVGEVGANTRGVEKILRRIGFKFAGTLDPFDGGPHFIATTDEITLIKGAKQRTVRPIETADSNRPAAIVAVTHADNSSQTSGFRANATRVVDDKNGQTVGIPKSVCQLLNIASGDPVWLTFTG